MGEKNDETSCVYAHKSKRNERIWCDCTPKAAIIPIIETVQ